MKISSNFTIFMVISLSLCCHGIFGWNAKRTGKNGVLYEKIQEKEPGDFLSHFRREILQKGAGDRETRRFRIKEYIRKKGSLTQEEDDQLFQELSTLMEMEKEEVATRGRRAEEDGATTTSGMTSKERQEALDVHNVMRRHEERASNMQKLTWNADLASLAQQWASSCRWGHGQPEDNLGYAALGQNLYFIQGLDSLNVTWSIKRWYDEKPFYVHDNITCLKTPCGHYTQLVWGDTRELGCGFQMCDDLEDTETGRVYKNAHHFVCNYYPTGNIPGRRPYHEGAPCSACNSRGQYLCDDQQPRGLCIGNCSESDGKCVCGADCLNGGTPTEDCACSCTDGWVGDRCENECKDFSAHCGVSPGYPKYTCKDKNHGEDIRDLCPKLCEVCNVSSSINTTTTTTTTTTATASTIADDEASMPSSEDKTNDATAETTEDFQTTDVTTELFPATTPSVKITNYT